MDFIHVTDIARAVVASLECDSGEHADQHRHRDRQHEHRRARPHPDRRGRRRRRAGLQCRVTCWSAGAPPTSGAPASCSAGNRRSRSSDGLTELVQHGAPDNGRVHAPFRRTPTTRWPGSSVTPRSAEGCWIGAFTVIDGSGGLTIGQVSTSRAAHRSTHTARRERCVSGRSHHDVDRATDRDRRTTSSSARTPSSRWV